MRLAILKISWTICFAASVAATAQPLPFEPAKPTEIGLSPNGLKQIATMLDQEVQAGRIAGAVTAVARHGRVGYLQAVGNREADQPMQTDSLFRIASMTKTITSAGVMSLVEEGQVSLDAPIAKYLPEFGKARVLTSIDGDDISTTQAIREPTIHDLLTHRSGLTYGWFGPEKLDAIYRHQDITGVLVPIHESLEQRVSRIAKVPLKFQPGTSWDYGVSTDVLGRVIEVVSGLTLDQFFRERFFRPLKMIDTHFTIPRSKENRLAGLYTIDENQSLRPVLNTPVTADFLTFSADYCDAKNQFYSGGGGLVSTTTDYLRFLQMLLARGQLEGHRVLQSETVALMMRNQIGDMQIPFGGHGDGFGFGAGVVTDRGAAADHASVGTFSWGGVFNTYFWVDPQEQLIGILMTQIFPYNDLKTRAEFKRLVYEAIDDSGFEHVDWYQPGKEHANPHFNGRQLRVNAPEASIHPKFAARSEPQSSGLARVLVEEDLRKIRRADLTTEIWGGHPGTANKRVSINGRSTHSIPDVGTALQHCTHQYPSFNLRPKDLVNGYNSLQFACDQGDTFWGHYIVDNVALKIGLWPNDERLKAANLSEFQASVTAVAQPEGEGFALNLSLPREHASAISAVHFQARYFGYDENGNGQQTDWHGMTKFKKPYGMLGTTTEAPFQLHWDTSMLPAQQRMEVRAVIEFKNAANLRYLTKRLQGLSIGQRACERMTIYESKDLPAKFWSRANNRKECSIEMDIDPETIVAAELHVVAWTGGAGNVKDYFTINGHHFPIAEGSGHETIYSRLPVDSMLLRRGENKISLLSDTTHHGIEIMLPGPTLVVRHRIGDSSNPAIQQKTNTRVRLVESARDESAGRLECYRIETPNATYYLDKVGAGLSSMVDRDGNDWLSFHPKPGSGAAGEYRGFPNAVFKEAGSYFHPRNSGTDPCVTIVELNQPDRVIISTLSGNGLWAGQYTFTPSACTFTMTKKPDGHKYWVLYEGTPGGQYDDSDWWMTSAHHKKHPLTTKHEGDIAGPEWIAFGDKRLNRMLVLSHDQDDRHADRFYEMQKKMTVFGFGRDGMKKLLNSVPQSFSIGFIETTDHGDVAKHIANISKAMAGKTSNSTDPTLKRRSLEKFALTHAGNAKSGRAIFFKDQRTKCATCHRVNKEGGNVGPDLSKVGGKFDRPHLIESLLHPSQQIVEGFRTSLILTDDGQTHSGIVKSRDDHSVTLIDSSNETHRITKAEIASQHETTVSLMPTGLADLLAPGEFTDLISFLETLKSGKAKFGSGVAGPVHLPAGFEIETIATGLSGATALEVAPDGRVFVCEQNGALRVMENDRLLETPFVTIPVEHNWERGLIGVTVSPNFPHDPYVFVVYVTDKPHTHHRVSRFRADGNVAVPGSEQILLQGDDQSKFGGNVPAGHQGGAIHFGTDGKLYIGLGEQTAKSPSQRMDALQGKILRLNRDGSIPNDNPFLSKTTGKYQSIWAIGCRNPFTFAVQNSTGELLINDVGGKFEEINRGSAGANYGWPVVDHGPTTQEGITPPLHIYPQASISGGDFSDEKSSWPHLFRGRYFFADFVHGWIQYIDLDAPAKSHSFAQGLRRPVDIRFSRDGSLYVLLRNAWVVDGKFEGGTGSLMKISYAGK